MPVLTFILLIGSNHPRIKPKLFTPVTVANLKTRETIGENKKKMRLIHC